MGKKMIITMTQSLCIRKHLDADDMSIPHEEFVSKITEESGAEQWIVEKLVENWRYWHPNGAAGGLRDAKELSERADELMYVSQPLPKPKQKTASAPENGTGIVAQILKLAAEGKSVKEIIDSGFNKSTVYRQVSEWRQRQKAAGGEVEKAVAPAAEVIV